MSSLRDILGKVAAKELTIVEAEKMLQLLAIDDVGCLARLDGNRGLRKGVPEVVLAEGKTPPDVAAIARRMVERCGRALISRCSDAHIAAVKACFADSDASVEVNDKAKMVIIKTKTFHTKPSGGRIGVLTAGTSDIPVAEEATIIAQEMGCAVSAFYDVGVAGIHRLLEPLKAVVAADVDVVVVVAGREGALASVVAGMVDVPVIAVPTSNSYGFGEKGVGTLMAMLQSCSLGLAVVNIDSGVAAGAVAALIANRAAKFR
ncbi:MAG: nickel pincer cofactor biosynthesis protein LarB [Candidatus Bathyarchaeota archaeon]|nr:nickel pincer cofactor biosynthesis protein LarB [Candidatus Bathyarchaeota archaeon]